MQVYRRNIGAQLSEKPVPLNVFIFPEVVMQGNISGAKGVGEITFPQILKVH